MTAVSGQQLSKHITIAMDANATAECNNSITNRSVKERLLLGSRRTFKKIFRQTIEVVIEKANSQDFH
jgi:hypothetical protein